MHLNFYNLYNATSTVNACVLLLFYTKSEQKSLVTVLLLIELLKFNANFLAMSSAFKLLSEIT